MSREGTRLDTADALESPTGRGRGRPRDPETEERILTAALALLGRDGFARMSIDAVAAAAGVTKPTVYRRFASKAVLATAALGWLAETRERSAPPETGELRADLVARLEHFRGGVSRPFGVALVGTVLAEEHETPTLLALYRELIVRPRRAMLAGVLERARDRGAVRAEVDLEQAVNMLIGAYYAHYLAGSPFPEDWAERVVETVVLGLLEERSAG